MFEISYHVTGTGGHIDMEVIIAYTLGSYWKRYVR